jgi:hypothetical protein
MSQRCEAWRVILKGGRAAYLPIGRRYFANKMLVSPLSVNPLLVPGFGECHEGHRHGSPSHPIMFSGIALRGARRYRRLRTSRRGSPQSVWDSLVAVLVDQQGLKPKEILHTARFVEDLGNH